MPASGNSRRQLVVEVVADASGVAQGVRPSQQAIRDLSDEIQRATNEFRLGGISADRYATDLLEIRNSALDMAEGLNRSSQEYRQLTSAALQADSALDKVEQSTRGNFDAVKLLQGGLASLGIAFGVQEVLRYAVSIGQMSEQADRSRQAVIALAGSTAEANNIIAAIQDAGGGAISQLDATGFAARALALGLADSAEEAALFTRTVTVLGASVGKDATESFDQLQLAIANLSFERLDSLGISASAVRVRFQELKQAGVEASEAFRIAVLEEAADRLHTLERAGFDASTGTERLGAAYADLSLTLGQQFAPAYQAGADALAEGLRWIDSNIEGLMSLSAFIGQIASLPTIIPRAAIGSLIDTSDELDKVINRMDELTKGIARMDEATQGQVDATDKGRDALADFGVIAAITAGETQALATQAGILESQLYDVAGAATVAGIALAAAVGADSIARFNSAFGKGGRSLSLDRGEGSGLGGGVEFIIEGYQTASKEAAAAAERAGRAGISAAEKAKREQERIAKEIAAAYEREFNRIGGFVDRALSFQGGVQAFDDLLDRTGVGRDETYTNEVIRRLEDVRDRALEGNRSQWIDKFLGIDDANLEVVAARAERRIRDLQAGLLTSTLDRESVIQDTLQFIEAERQAKEFRDSIVRDIIARSGGTQAEVQAALGQTLGDAGTGAGSEVGVAINESILAEIEANAATYETAGFSIGLGLKRGIPKGLAGIGEDVAVVLIEETTAALEAATP